MTATVTAPNGQSVLLVYEAGAWRVDGSAIDLYSQATPASAVLAFVRAFENRRYDVLLRFVPDSERSGLDAEQLRKAWEEGEQRAGQQVGDLEAVAGPGLAGVVAQERRPGLPGAP